MDEKTSFMAQFGATLADNGYRVIPILPGQKAPGRYAQGVWTPYPDWSRHCTRATRGFELDIWQRWPDCAVGVACGNAVGIDIDVMDETAASKIEAMAREMLGDTPAKRIGLAPKRMLIYRAPEPFAGRKRLPLEVLATGQQFVAYALHPITGQPYQWPDESLTELDISRLPAITEAQAMEWLQKAYALVPPELRPASLSSGQGRSPSWSGPSDPKGTLAAVADALRFLPNEDCDGTSWIMMCNAIKAALGEEGRGLWLDWSKSSTKSGASGKSDTAERRWKNARPRNIGAGTIYWLAEQRGWAPAPELVLNAGVAATAAEVHPAAGLISKMLSRATAERHSANVAPGIMDLDGAIKMLVDYSVATAFSPQPFLALGAAIAAVGALAGRRYASPTDLRTNVFVVGLADSSSGKDQPRKCIKRAFFEAGVDRYFGGERLASGQSIYSSIEIHPSRLFLLNEFGKIVQEITGRNASHKAEILTNLTSLFTSASEVVFGTEYAHQKGSDARARVDLHQPHVCVYGDTVAAVLWRAMQSGALGDGSVARFLVFQSPDDCPDYNRNQSAMDVPPELVEQLKAIAGGVPGHDYGGNLAEMMQATVDMVPYVVPYGNGVAAYIDKAMDEQLQWKRENRNTWATAFIGRSVEHTIRVAMIRAISREPADPVIMLSDIVWAQHLVEHCLVTAMRETDANVADSAAEGNVKRLLDVVRKVGGSGLTKTELMKKTRFLETRQRNAIIADLIEGGDLWPSQEKGVGDKPVTRYSASPGRAWQRQKSEGGEENAG